MDRRLATTRTRALSDLALLRQLPTPELRKTARLAAHIARNGAQSPFATIHLLDEVAQHRLAAHGGVPLVRTPIEDSMCIRVLEQDRAIYTSDASQEAIFAGSPFTSGDDPVRLYYATPLRTSAGTAVGTLCVFATEVGELDLEQRARLDDLATQTGSHLELLSVSRDLAHIATHDSLTEVANRLLLSRELELALHDPARLPHEPALLLIDLDDFKQVNDQLGHAAGDEVLRSTARRLMRAVRNSTDLVARLGGDEFAVLLVDLPDPGRLDELAERIRAVVETPHETEHGPVRCSASVGAALGQAGDLGYELLGRADEDMYRRKAAGRIPAQR